MHSQTSTRLAPSLSPSTPSPHRETRAKKRQRLLSRSEQLPSNHARSTSRKRTHEMTESGTNANRKRRRSSHPKSTEPEEIQLKKRARTIHLDTDMEDVEGQEEGICKGKRERRRRMRLCDVMKEERVYRAVLKELQRNYVRGRDLRVAMEKMQKNVGNDDGVGERRECEMETIDVSETTEGRQRTNGGYGGIVEEDSAEVKPYVEAVLLEDGRCAVQIVRADGNMQRVIIQPPQMEEYYD